MYSLGCRRMLGQAPLELTWLLYNPISRVIGELPLWSVLCHHSLSSCQSRGLLHWKGQRVSMGVLGCDIWFLEYSLHFQSGKSVLELESPISSFPTCGIRTYVITSMTEGPKSRWSIQANPLHPKELPRRENPQTSYKVSGRPHGQHFLMASPYVSSAIYFWLISLPSPYKSGPRNT